MFANFKEKLKKLRPLTSLTKRLDNLLFAQAIENRVQSAEDRAILLLLLLYKRKVVLDDSFAVFENIKSFLSCVQPAKIANLVRIGGAHDGGYVMQCPPPPFQI